MRQILAKCGFWTAGLLSVMCVLAVANVKAVTVYGVTTSNQLIRFDSATPATVATVGAVGGLQTGENIVGIDFRPATGQLFALGSTSRLYTLSLTTGAATQVGAAGAFTLSGTSFAFDFNPVPDRIRVVSNTGQNLRLNPDNGALAATDTPISPATANVTAAAYTNNVAGATVTTLYVIDTTTDTLNLQGSIGGTPNSPNAGALTPVGLLGVEASDVNGFDIASIDGTAYAALTVGGTARLYNINLNTGLATQIGTFPAGTNVSGIAVAFGSGVNRTSVLDYDGDRRTDLAVFRPDPNTQQGTYFVRPSAGTGFASVQFGLSSDIQVPGDYNGDGRTDYAVWRPSNGTFYVLTTGTNAFTAFQFGQNGDEPVARDYDGDGRTDYAVVRRANGQSTWFIASNGSTTFNAFQFGLDTDVTAPGDYDGDGRFDIAVYRGANNSQATFFIQQSTAGFRSFQFGLGSDLVVPGDYDGDGRFDFAVVRAGSLFTWYILNSSNNSFRQVQFGAKPQFTAQGDYDGDGRTDIATFNPINGTFFILRSSGGAALQQQFGQNGDYPVANFDTH